MSSIIEILEINLECMESYPCQHEVRVRYGDGSIGWTILSARTIAKHPSYNSLSAAEKTHFEYARNL